MSSDALNRSERRIALPERYRVRRHIATGGMASVWCAEDLVLGRSVAVKVLAERFAHDALAVRRFQREARAAARVSGHPHVVTIYDVGEMSPQDGADATHTAGRAFIVMEFLAGGTVADAIRHDTVGRAEALRWLGEAASALDHAHARGIVHRDIKPANFLLDRRAGAARSLHVADFGIAHLSTEETITSSDQLFGTAAYLSPEQALGLEATGASDRYALAVAAFELLTGERPFSAPHFSAQARQHIEEPPPAASEIEPSLPPAVDDVLFDGLAKEPEARPQTAGAFVTALTDALSGRTPPAPRARRPVRPLDPAAPAASTAAARRGETTRTRVRDPLTRTAQGTGPAGRRPRRLVALGALATALLVIAGIVLATTGGGSGGARLADHSAQAQRHRHHRSHRASTGARHVARRTAATSTSATSTTATEASHTEPTAVALESRGHQEILDGDYETAISTLQQAVSSAAPTSDTYAYALYDLGHAELLNGDPAQAVQILRQRLKIDNQRPIVQSLLDDALAQLGQSTTTPSSGGAAPTTTSPATTTTGSATTPTTPTTPSPPTKAPPAGRGSGGAGLYGPASGKSKKPKATPPGHGGTTPPGHANRLRRHDHHHNGLSPLTLITAVAGD